MHGRMYKVRMRGLLSKRQDWMKLPFQNLPMINSLNIRVIFEEKEP